MVKSCAIQHTPRFCWHNSQEKPKNISRWSEISLQTDQVTLESSRRWTILPEITEEQHSVQPIKIDSKPTWKKEFEINVNAYQIFLNTNLSNPYYRDKYVVFIHGILCGIGEIKTEIIKKIQKKYGDIDMYVGRISENRPTVKFRSPMIF